MLRRDFLKTISAFAAASAVGGSAAAAAASRPIVGSQLTADGIRVPAGPHVLLASPLDMEIVRGEDVEFFVAGLKVSPGLHFMSAFIGPQRPGPGDGIPGIVEPGGDGITLRFLGRSTGLLRPGPRPWHLACDGRVLLAGTATILPDDIWRAEESVLAIVPKMHAMGVASRRGDRYETYFRAKLRDGEQSRYSDHVASLMEHCRPVHADIINGGVGCRIDFAHKGLL